MIDARVWIDEGMSGQGGGVSLNVSWPTGGSASLAFDPTYNDPGRPGFPNLYQTFTTDVAVSTTANGDFILEPVFTAPDVDIFGAGCRHLWSVHLKSLHINRGAGWGQRLHPRV